MQSQKHFLIKDLANQSGLSTDTIRFYEKKKLVSASFRGANQYRYYDENSLKRIIFIKHCRALDLSLAEIFRLIELEQNPSQSCHEVNQMINNHLTQVTNKIEELIKFKQQLQFLKTSCTSTNKIEQCEILKHLESKNN